MSALALETGRGPGPAEQVRAKVREAFGDQAAQQVPEGYQRLGSVLVVRLPESLRPAFPLIGETFRTALGVETVLRRTGPVSGEFREPSVEPIAGGGAETTVLEHGVRYRFDAARVLFARGNADERSRFGRLVRPGETVVDLFAGIGYFTLPALVIGRAGAVHAVEKNPLSFTYLSQGLALNHFPGRAYANLGDNREVAMPERSADRVVLGYLPSALPWVGLSLRLLRPEAGWLHVHLLVGTQEGPEEAARQVEGAIVSAGGRVVSTRAHEVKPYGPGRSHIVVDVRAIPGRAA